MAAKIYSRLFRQLRDRGVGAKNARRIAQAALTKRGHIRPGTLEATPAGEVRGNMTAKEREKDRALKRSIVKP